MQARQLLPLILCFVGNREPVQGRTRMQKMIFLMQKELDLNEYKFEPADFGPFSWQLSNDLDYLVSRGFITVKKTELEEGEKYEYTITRLGRELVNNVLRDKKWGRIFSKPVQKLDSLKTKYNHLNLMKLLLSVYTRYPEFATKSRVLFQRCRVSTNTYGYEVYLMGEITTVKLSKRTRDRLAEMGSKKETGSVPVALVVPPSEYIFPLQWPVCQSLSHGGRPVRVGAVIVSYPQASMLLDEVEPCLKDVDVRCEVLSVFAEADGFPCEPFLDLERFTEDPIEKQRQEALNRINKLPLEGVKAVLEAIIKIAG